MAVFYKWIKGCNAGASTDSGQWTYLEWSNAVANPSTSVESLPILYVSAGKQDTLISNQNVRSLGYILTNNVQNVQITQDWEFHQQLFFGEKDSTGSTVALKRKNKNCFVYDDISENFYLFTRDWTINDTSNDLSDNGSGSYATALHIHGKHSSAPKIEFGSYYPVEIKNSLTVSQPTTLNDTLTVNGATTLNNTLTISNESETSINTSGGIYASKQCEAKFFNATSDKRAKENIQPATYNALELINKLPVYIYNYKNNTETVTGILAQDLLEAQPEGLDLVSNVNATGENDDYMSIKNDKLMFVLMKAIQEQQQQINDLKAEIEQLKQA